MADLRCVSPCFANSSTRCPNPRVGKSNFCLQHTSFVRDYEKIKSLENPNQKLIIRRPDFTKMEEDQIRLGYTNLIKIYDRRTKYRQKAFCPETWDKGHLTWIRLIWTRIEEFASELIRINDTHNGKDLEDESDSEDDQEDSLYLENLSFKKISKNSKLIKKRESAWQVEIPQLIQENERFMEKNIQRVLEAFGTEDKDFCNFALDIDRTLAHQISMMLWGIPDKSYPLMSDGIRLRSGSNNFDRIARCRKCSVLSSEMIVNYYLDIKDQLSGIYQIFKNNPQSIFRLIFSSKRTGILYHPESKIKINLTLRFDIKYQDLKFMASARNIEVMLHPPSECCMCERCEVDYFRFKDCQEMVLEILEDHAVQSDLLSCLIVVEKKEHLFVPFFMAYDMKLCKFSDKKYERIYLEMKMNKLKMAVV